jgi:hypothetical protein
MRIGGVDVSGDFGPDRPVAQVSDLAPSEAETEVALPH